MSDSSSFWAVSGIHPMRYAEYLNVPVKVSHEKFDGKIEIMRIFIKASCLKEADQATFLNIIKSA